MSEIDETIQMLRSECEALGIKWHSRHSEEGLRKLITEASVSDPEPEPAPVPPAPTPSVPDGFLSCIVTKAGDGKIHNGDGGYFKRGDSFHMPELAAQALENKHFVEAD